MKRKEGRRRRKEKKRKEERKKMILSFVFIFSLHPDSSCLLGPGTRSSFQEEVKWQRPWCQRDEGMSSLANQQKTRTWWRLPLAL